MRAAILVEVAADVVDANARPDPSAAATVSVTAAGAGVPVVAASFIAATEAGVPAPVVAAEAGTPTSAAATTFTAIPRVDVPASAAAAAFVAATGAGVLASPAAVVPVVAAGADSLSFVATAIPVMAVGATASVSATAVGLHKTYQQEEKRYLWLRSGRPVCLVLASIAKPYAWNQKCQHPHAIPSAQRNRKAFRDQNQSFTSRKRRRGVPMLMCIAPCTVCNKMRGATTATYLTHHFALQLKNHAVEYTNSEPI
nr:uncharacterized protein LOC117835662 [Setaria viridis]